MPILDVELVSAEAPDARLAGDLAEMAGALFGSPPGGTWVRVRTLPPAQYAENGIAQPEGWRSVFVRVLKAERPEGDVLAAEMRALAAGVARLCGREAANVHILYEPSAAGRIAFGGELRA